MIENHRSGLVWNVDAQEPVRAARPASAPASPAAGSTGRVSPAPAPRPRTGCRTARRGARCARAARPLALAGCGRATIRRHRCASGRWAARARSSPSCCRSSSARIPASSVDVQQMPWTAAHEKLLTAFAGDATPDVCQLGNTWIPEFAALGALEPLDARLAALAGDRARRLLRRHLDTNVVERRRLLRRAVVRRHAPALLPHATCSRAPAIARAARRPGPSGCAAMRRVKAARRPARYAILLPLERVRAAARAGAAAGRRCCATATATATSAQPRVPARARLLRRHVPRRPRAARDRQRRSPTSGSEFGARHCSPSTSPGPGTSASSGAACRAELQGDWTTAPLPGPDGPGRLDRRRLEPRHLPRLATQGRGLAADRVPREPATMQRFHALTGDLPPRRSAWRAPALADDAPLAAFARQLERVRAAPKVPEWERIVQEMQLAAERVVAAHGRASTPPRRSSTPGSTRCSRSAAGCARERLPPPAGDDADRRRRLGAGRTGAGRHRRLLSNT